MKDQITKGYDVYINGEFKGFVAGQNKTSRQSAAQTLVRSTHMAQWVRFKDGRHEYRTTIGRYVLFVPCKRLSAMIGQYLIGHV